MATLAPCGPCQIGQHDRHVEHWDDPGPGVLGGAFCNCPGDCTPPDLSALFTATTEGTTMETPSVTDTFTHPCADCGTTVYVNGGFEQPHEHHQLDEGETLAAFAWWQGHNQRSAIADAAEAIDFARMGFRVEQETWPIPDSSRWRYVGPWMKGTP